MANTRELQILINAKDNASKTISNVGSSVKGLAKDATIGAAVITGAFALVAKSAVNIASNYEQSRISFETMLGSGKDAGKLLKDISDFARKTPFDLPQVVEGSKRLLAYNVAGKDIIPTFKMLGNIAAGVGTDKLPQLILAFGQVKAATYLTGAELRQFTEAGVPLLDALSKQSGKTASQIKEDMESGIRIPFTEVQEALLGMTEKGGKFYDLMAKQSQSLGGIVSNLRDNFIRFALTIMGISEEGDIREGSFFYYLKLGAEELQRRLDELQPKLQTFVDYLMSNKEILLAFFAGLAGLVIALGVQFAIMLGPALLVAGAFALIGALIGVLIEKNGGLQKTWEDLKAKYEEIKPTLDQLRNDFQTIANAVKSLEDEAMMLYNMMSAIAVFFMSILRPALDVLRSAVNMLMKEISMLGIKNEHLATVAKLVAGIFAGLFAASLAIIIGLILALIGFITVIIGVITALIRVIREVKAWWDNLSASVRNAMGIFVALNPVLNSILAGLKAIKAIGKITIDIVQKFSSTGKKESRQHGGFINAPWGEAVPATLHGGERVLPRTGVDVNTGGMGTSNNINLNFTGPISMDTDGRIQDLADRIINILNRQNELANKGLAI